MSLPPVPTTQEPQYKRLLEVEAEAGRSRLGLMMNQAWYDDPKRLTFTFARYKFVAKMMAGFGDVLEVGCGDAFPSRIVQQEVERLSVCDFDPLFIKDIRECETDRWAFADVFVHDVLASPPPSRFQGIYALDVLEHIQPSSQHRFIGNLVQSLQEHGTLIIGMPSLESQEHASALSKEGHVNCQTLPQLKDTMQQHFHNVFMFCMNDEVLHVGFSKMAQYLFAVCCSPRSDRSGFSAL
ncbi:class I SAM-dependent methyltransferase [Azospirillum sp. BE72]|uniref:class I SAM-dependent methyltransferase n=1 Tax=Azospirillum sp. BE72 TaxID=2817776 RepID=UPI00285D2492|nr:class I SAM-dependent methyltransferase [Azospirillum sp. BE72]MDR6774188.1 SAM-dependent methyltransferase [Azospirillum sp. BE72]